MKNSYHRCATDKFRWLGRQILDVGATVELGPEKDADSTMGTNLVKGLTDDQDLLDFFSLSRLSLKPTIMWWQESMYPYGRAFWNNHFLSRAKSGTKSERSSGLDRDKQHTKVHSGSRLAASEATWGLTTVGYKIYQRLQRQTLEVAGSIPAGIFVLFLPFRSAT